MKKIMYKKIMIVRPFIIISLLLFVSCAEKQQKEDSPKVVKTTKINYHTPLLTKNYPAKINPASNVRLSFRVAGPIQKILVDEGEHVEQGQLLAQIDSRDYEIQLQGTKAKYEEIKAEVKRIKALYKKDKISDNEYDKAISGLSQISAQYEAHKNELADTRLTAPFSGHIHQIFFDENEIADAGMPVVSVTDTQRFEIVTHIPASDFLNRENFKEFFCRTSENPVKKWPLELRNIGSQANLNGLYPVYFNLKNPDNSEILSGMSAEISVKYKTDYKNLFSVPSSAIFNDKQQSTIWILDTSNNTIHAQEINIVQIKSSGQTIIEGDLKKGETVVSAGVHSLTEGQEVTEMKEPSESNIGGLL